jgi:hypothetical protein
MKTVHTKETRIRIAVPYYGALLHPQSGIATIYFIAHVDTGSRQILGLQMRVWDASRQPHLSLWLLQQEVCGLICLETKSPYVARLQHEGVWVHFGQNRDADEMVTDWLHGGDATGRDKLVA